MYGEIHSIQIVQHKRENDSKIGHIYDFISNRLANGFLCFNATFLDLQFHNQIDNALGSFMSCHPILTLFESPHSDISHNRE